MYVANAKADGFFSAENPIVRSHRLSERKHCMEYSNLSILVKFYSVCVHDAVHVNIHVCSKRKGRRLFFSRKPYCSLSQIV